MEKLKQRILYIAVLLGIFFLIYHYLPDETRETFTFDSSNLTEISVLMRNGYFPDSNSDPITYKKFHKQIAKEIGIKLNIDYYETNDELLEILSDNSRRKKYDVAITSDFLVNKLVNQKLIGKINSSSIPRISNINDVFSNNKRFQSLKEYSVPFSFQTIGLMSNAWKIEDILINWDYLFEPEKFGHSSLKFLMPSDPRVSMGIAMIYSKHKENQGIGTNEGSTPNPNTTNRESIDQARDLLIQMIEAYDFNFGSTRDITNNEFDVAASWSGDVAKEMEAAQNRLIKRSRNNNGLLLDTKISNIEGEHNQDQIPKIRFSSPAPGVIVYYDCFVILNESQKNDSAHKFINFILKPEVSASITNYSKYGNTNKHSIKYLDRRVTNGASYFTPGSLSSYPLETLDKETEIYYKNAWDQVISSYNNKRMKNAAIK